MSIEQRAFPEDTRIAAIHLPPGGVAQHDRVRILPISKRIYVLVKAVADLRSNIQRGKEIGADIGEIDFQRSRLTIQEISFRALNVIGNLIECLVLLLPRSEV